MNNELNFSVNIIIPLLSSLIVTALVTKMLIPFLKKVKTTQQIHDDAPDSHQLKSGTPTMGGLAIILGIIVGCGAAMLRMHFSLNMLTILFIVVVFGMVGFLDDYTKVAKKRNLGLTAREKLGFQIIAAFGVAFYYVYIVKMGTHILIPFSWQSVNIGLWMIPLLAFIMVAMVNSVNLTDGLDGLAASISTVVCVFFPVIANMGLSLLHFQRGDMGSNFEIDSNVDTMFFAAAAGACLGFLIYNRYPARIFMGDTGSLALGGGIAAAAIFIRMELMLPILGLIYVIEALSVIIQVASFKLRKGKRVFKMAPIHHHFELSGWSERKVVTVFISCSLLISATAVIVVIIQALMQ